MCCSVINNDQVETILTPFDQASGYLVKMQTFVPILGIVPAAAFVVVRLIEFITAIVLKFFANEEDQKKINEAITCSVAFMGYSIINIASGGLFAPICEYVTQFLSTNRAGEKTATAGFFDIFPTLWRGEAVVFL